MNEIFNKKYIKSNTSPYAISILIVKKFDKRFRIYIDYRALNILIIKNRNILFLIKEILIKLYTTKIFNKFDIITVFNKIRIKKKWKKKTIFFIRYKLFEYIIISFELCNIFNIFQIFINNVLRKYFDNFYSIYLNNILIYNNNKKKYIEYIKKKIKNLKQTNLYFDINKY